MKYQLTDLIVLKLKSGKTISVSNLDAIRGTIWEELLDEKDAAKLRCKA